MPENQKNTLFEKSILIGLRPKKKPLIEKTIRVLKTLQIQIKLYKFKL